MIYRSVRSLCKWSYFIAWSCKIYILVSIFIFRDNVHVYLSSPNYSFSRSVSKCSKIYKWQCLTAITNCVYKMSSHSWVDFIKCVDKKVTTYIYMHSVNRNSGSTCSCHMTCLHYTWKVKLEVFSNCNELIINAHLEHKQIWSILII